MPYKHSVVFSILPLLLAVPFLGDAESAREREARDLDRTPRERVEIRGAFRGTAYVEGEVLVKFRGEKRVERVALARDESVEVALLRLNAEAEVEYAEPDYIAHAFLVPGDPFYRYQWHLDGAGGIGMEEAWNSSEGDGVVVAVIDTGVAYENYDPPGSARYYLAPDLADTSFVPGWDFVEDDARPNDDNGHGTHVAGTIAQSTGNGIGVAGVAFEAQIMPIKALNADGTGTYSGIAEGIIWAADHGAKVINLSLGGSAGSQTMKNALKYAYDKGVTIIAASGNDGAGSISYPAAYNDYVIAVGATRYDRERSNYANYGPGLDLVAPGGQMCANFSRWYCITNDQNGDGYGDGVLQQTFSGSTDNFGYYFFQGTSMAAPHVAGVAALVIAHKAATEPDDVREALESTADDLGVPGWDSIFGYGIVNAPAALAYTAELPPPPPPTGPEPAPEPEPQPEQEPPPEPEPAPEPEPEPDHEPPAAPVADAALDLSSSGRWFWRARADLTIETDGLPLSGAQVYGAWSGAATQSVSGRTSSSGRVTFRTPYIWGSGTTTFTIEEIVKDGIAYILEGETSESIGK